nr:unnamed protein product [Spirometra erinaceieuropaei]
MTSLSLVLLFAVTHALVCQASPAYEILQVADEEGVSEGLKSEGAEEQEAVQEQEEEEDEKRSSELKADAEELETGLMNAKISMRRRSLAFICCILNLDAILLEEEEEEEEEETFGDTFSDASNDLETICIAKMESLFRI